jgi:tetracycline resistance efflux pump
MHDYGFWSLLPPLLAIFLAIRTKQVYISLLLGIWLSWVIINHGNIFKGTYRSIMALVDVFKDAGNTKTIMFSALVGGLIILIQKSGGVTGFVMWIDKKLGGMKPEHLDKNRKKIQLFAWLTGIFIFVETSISALTVGTVFRPLFDKLKISREKLAYIADSSSAPTSIIIPFNAWGAFIMGLLLTQGFDHGFQVLFQSMRYNFYPFLALFLVLIVILFDFNIGPMKQAEERVRTQGKVLSDDAKPMISDALTNVDMVVKASKSRAYNMVLPLLVMVLMMPVTLIIDGWEAATKYAGDGFAIQKVVYALGKGSGSTAVLIAVITALFFAMILYRFQNIAKTTDMFDWVLKGISEMMPLALLMMLAFAISHVTRELGTGQYVAELSKNILSPAMVPLMIFLITAFVAFATGTSWGTFAIMIPIAAQMAHTLEVNPYLSIAAVLSGGVFGDHSSPISDTTIISSMASASDHIDHVKTQLPYALLAGSMAGILFLIAGLTS